MRTATKRYFILGIVLLGVAASLWASWRFSHLLFAMIAIFFGLLGPLIVVARNGWNQTDPQNLAERGMSPDSAQEFDMMDPGLRRDMAPVIPVALSRRMSRNRTSRPPAAPATRARPLAAPVPTRTQFQAAPSAVKTKPARSGKARRKDETLRPDATVKFAGERQAAGIDDLLAALDSELIGLVPVKKKVEEIGSLLLVDRARQRFGLSAAAPNLHMCFTGPPGTGKTTVALMMADLLYQLGYLEKGHVVHAMRNDLVGEYIGHTAPKTKRILQRAMGGVLFIDEAYDLFRAQDSKDYGQETVDILLQVMENDRDKLVVILAGYRDRMDRFFESNPGMRSRIAHHLDFAEYDIDELLAIGRLMLDRSSYYLSDEGMTAFRDGVLREMRQPGFANARSVRNRVENARLWHAYRLAAEPGRHLSKDDLMRLEPQDILPDLAATCYLCSSHAQACRRGDERGRRWRKESA
jgi:probable Rubsico expression protein CbbX